VTLLQFLVKFPTHTPCDSKGTVADTVSFKFSYKLTIFVKILPKKENMHFGQIGNMVPGCCHDPTYSPPNYLVLGAQSLSSGFNP
jgi:hypothetical protein